MKLPRDLSGRKLAKLLSRYGYQISRQTGSHVRLTSTIAGTQHHITIPAGDRLKLGTLSAILNDVASHLDRPRQEMERELFG